jgi:general L-amino acid transport system substrate-binding protein
MSHDAPSTPSLQAALGRQLVFPGLFSESVLVEQISVEGDVLFVRVRVLFHNVTWLDLRDATMDPPNSGVQLAFGILMFYDGQRLMVPTVSGIEQLEDPEGRTICVLADSRAERILNEQFATQGIGFEIERLSEQQLYDVYERGGCDAITAATAELVGQRSAFLRPEAHYILDESISNESYHPIYRANDPAWADVVNRAVFATIHAELLDVNSSNIRAALNQGNPNVERLLGERGFIGERLGLENDFAYQIIEQVGNYRDIYNRHVGPATLLDLPSGPNKTWNSPEGQGGLLGSVDI